MAKDIQPKIVLAYADEYGNEPFTKWLESLKDRKTAERIRVRLRRLESGLYGDCQPVGEGVLELRMFFGSGYRVYFGEDKGNIVILLCGGDKSSQKQDIKAAKIYWKDYKDNG
ncbi:type II toxin-antitoxin system RelE/ParE family toxin [Myxosarcina sp. GI1(2024)]